jgi:hypothetical protein
MKISSPLSLYLLSWSLLLLGLGLLTGSRASALPGQSTEEVSSWIQANRTLQPSNGERLFVQKSDTAARRFEFQASVLPPGKVTFPTDRGTIRTERFSLFDVANGVTPTRLQESLRAIYGLDIYQDFERGRIVYQYPNESAINTVGIQKIPLRQALQGQVRLGDRYAYWLEIAQPEKGKAINGQMTIFLKSDLNKLESELRNR